MFLGLASGPSQLNASSSRTLLPLTSSGYMIPLGVLYILPSLLAVGMFFLPESPRWLVLKNKPAQAEEALAWLRPRAWQVGHELEQITAAIVIDETRPGAIWADYFDLVVGRGRLRTLLSLTAATLTAATGFGYVNSMLSPYLYGTLFGSSGTLGYLRSNLSLVFVGTSVAFLLLVGVISVPFGRRRLWLMALMGIAAVAQLVLAALVPKLSSYSVINTDRVTANTVSAMFILLYYVRQAVLGYSFVTAAEFPSQRLRPYTYGLALAIELFFEVSRLTA